jgi:hypothetical protein
VVVALLDVVVVVVVVVVADVDVDVWPPVPSVTGVVPSLCET